MTTILHFPLRRLCVLGVPEEVSRALKVELHDVAVSTDGGGVPRSDLLVVAEGDGRALEVVRWVRASSPEFPIVFWSARTHVQALVEICRTLLFGVSSAARSTRADGR